MGYNWTGLGNERGSTSKCTDVACVFQITNCHEELDYNFEYKETNNVENTLSAQMYGQAMRTLVSFNIFLFSSLSWKFVLLLTI